LLSPKKDEKRPSLPFFQFRPRAFCQQRLYGRSAVLCFPLLERFVIAPLSLNHFASMRILVNLQLARLSAASFGLDGWSAMTWLWIQQIDHILEAVAVVCEQIEITGFSEMP